MTIFFVGEILRNSFFTYIKINNEFESVGEKIIHKKYNNEISPNWTNFAFTKICEFFLNVAKFAKILPI